MHVAVVGGGVSGLTCGVRLLEDGARVTLVARDAPASTTSAVAGAVWFPYRVRPNERTGPWGSVGYERFSRMAEQPGMPVTMVELTILYGDALAEEPWWLASVPGDGVRAAAVGLRPARSEVRLEATTLADGRALVHNYGHGGSGFTLSWGCADEVARLVLARAA